MTDLAREIIARADRMRSERSAVDSLRQQVRDYIIPTAQSILSREAAGTKSGDKVLDNTGETVHEVLAGAVVSTLTPDTVDWAGVKCADDDVNEDDAAIAWFEDSSKRMARVFRRPGASFFTTQYEVIDSAVGYGDGCKFIPYVPGFGLMFVTVPVDEALIDEDAYGKVDTVFRDYKLTARQAVQRWGNACPPKVIKAAADDKTANDTFRFVHAVYPRTDRDPEKRDVRNMPFASVDVCVDEIAVVAESGFHEMPYVYSRWAKRAGEKYGRGCGMKALNDVKSLQRAMKIQFIGSEKVMNPSLLVVDDGVTGPIRAGSGGITYIRPGIGNTDPIRPLNTGARPDLSEPFIQGIRDRVGNAYFKDQVRVLRTDRMTATEYLGAMEENNRILGPFLGRQKDEDIGATVERVFGMMLRMGVFKPVPPILQGRQVVADYVSPLVRQQRIAQARGLSQFNDVTGPLAAVAPEVLDNLDTDRIYRETGDILALPKSWFLSADQVAAKRAARQKQREAQAQRQEMTETVDTAANAVRALPALKQAMGGGDATA